MPSSSGERTSKKQFIIKRVSTKELSRVLTAIRAEYQARLDVMETEFEILKRELATIKSSLAPKKRGRPRKEETE